MISTTNKYFILPLTSLLLGAFFISACGHQNNAQVAGSAQPAPAASPSATASALSGTPAPPPGTATSATPAPTARAGEPQPGATGQPKQTPSMSHLAVVKTEATPTPKPEPTPTPAATPVIKRENGKIVQSWQAPAEFAKLTNPVGKKPDAAKTGKAFYDERCADCHGKEGLGNGPMARLKNKQATNLASEVVQANTDGELFYKVTNTDKERLPHPKSQERFTDEQRWYIVAYLRTLKR
ncbi:MAG TPA: cytochrome c [Blastocatellia bacterium]|nr:cytochrome c [Blastocatellia bacterium]